MDARRPQGIDLPRAVVPGPAMQKGDPLLAVADMSRPAFQDRRAVPADALAFRVPEIDLFGRLDDAVGDDAGCHLPDPRPVRGVHVALRVVRAARALDRDSACERSTPVPLHAPEVRQPAHVAGCVEPGLWVRDGNAVLVER